MTEEVKYMYSMNDLILKKRNGGVLTEEEIRYIVNGYTDGSIPDYQMSAFLMAVWFKGMNDDETVKLTMAMAESGDMLDLSKVKKSIGESAGKDMRIIDKHSTGGVGDKTTLIIGPVLAALGVPVVKMSGRGLGHTGGTIDKLESIPGFSSALSEESFIDQVKRIGFADMCQTGNLAPADKKIYALRDVTGTVDNISLIASSIMSKKLAAGAEVIVLDVKCGSGAFMKDISSAKKLAEIMVSIGKKCGRSVTAVISDMNEPLGRFVGNSLEVMEVVEILKGCGDERLRELSVKLAAEMLLLAEEDVSGDKLSENINNKNVPHTGTEIACNDEEKDSGRYNAAEKRIKEVIQNGKALQKFREFVAAQGGDTGFIDGSSSFEAAKYMIPVRASESGILVSCDTEKIGLASLHLGGGREKISDEIDHSVGIEICHHLGDKIEKNDTLAILYANDEAKAETAAKFIKEAYKTEAEPTDGENHKLIYEIIR
ncbi:MAG: thymidine phosphorylase [Eubacterium sp.]|nr:thymidine phosphorylase [Eubacterium sp.]